MTGTEATQFFFAPDNYLSKDYNVVVRRQLVAELIGPLESKSILDVGCGDGRVSLQFAGANRVHLVDASPSMLELARKHAGSADHVTLTHATLEECDLAPRSYDVILAMGILAHLPVWQAGLARFVSALKLGGKLVVQISDASRWLVRKQLPPSGKRTHWLNAIRYGDLEAEAARLGLIVKTMRRFGFTVPGMGRLPNGFLTRLNLFTARHPIFGMVATEVIAVFELRGRSAGD